MRIDLRRNAALLVVGTLLLTACGVDQKDRAALNEGYGALQQGNLDQAVAVSDQYLKKHPTGQGAAEAYYLRGRAFEDRMARSDAEARENLQNARASYIAGLQANPPRNLKALIQSGIGNVAFWQEDYATAQQQWQEAYDLSNNPEDKAMVLYRLGRLYQRAGQFDVADKTFADVQRQYPNTRGAQDAKERQGYHQFVVQLGTYANPNTANATITDVRGKGLTPLRATNAKGQQVISVGPVPTYQQAQQLRARFASQYPDALIIP